MTTPVTKLLTEAKLLISDKVNWAQGVYAKNEKGLTVDNMDDEATCFCSLGALHRAAVTGIVNHFIERDAINTLHEVIPVRPEGWRSIAAYNDGAGRTHEEVMKVFDDAIALAAGKGV